jgi:hypothetical protein
VKQSACARLAWPSIQGKLSSREWNSSIFSKFFNELRSIRADHGIRFAYNAAK